MIWAAIGPTTRIVAGWTWIVVGCLQHIARHPLGGIMGAKPPYLPV